MPLVQHAYDLDAIAARVGPRTRLVIIGNSNNPTGLALSKAALDRFLNRLPRGPVVCLDEAYAEYAAKPDFPNSLDYIATGRSLLAVRSLSKAYGLAGLRMGYAIAPEGLALSLNNQRQRFNTSSLAQIAAARRPWRFKPSGEHHRFECKRPRLVGHAAIAARTIFSAVRSEFPAGQGRRWRASSQ